MSDVTEITKDKIVIMRFNVNTELREMGLGGAPSRDDNEFDLDKAVDDDNGDKLPVLNHRGVQKAKRNMKSIEYAMEHDLPTEDYDALEDISKDPKLLIRGFKDGYCDIPYKSDGDILVESHGSFVRIAPENDYTGALADDCWSNESEMGEGVIGIKDEYGEDLLLDGHVYYNILRQLDTLTDPYGDDFAKYETGGADNITIVAHNNAKSRKHITKLVETFDPEFVSEWKHALLPKATHCTVLSK